ncbi:diacylglycerol/lipid kinase family protein [Palleronia pelagia]|uniref:Diacylglycerol kinase family enzyme n=1 Tax=Palleronia pelagia TaxID=387096 RepID=A0A1H8J8C0_9RHOB|nr:diacylglycerol kinase family protein [Palleronia pelagia]SEN76841.1 Diacylglycerol kinase family enzyme [Palleronia pelagia]
MPAQIRVIANHKSGRNSRDRQAIEQAMEVFGPDARRIDWQPGSDLSALIDRAVADGGDLVVAAGGDGTVMATAGAMVGRDVPMAVLPLGTFNFFARGLGFSEDPETAARQIVDGQPHDIRVGRVNGQTFLNNASLGIYPKILRERETVYRRWGRRRIAAHWSVLKTMLRFRKPLRLTLDLDGQRSEERTAMIFVARSAYQLDFFGLNGADLISDDRFAVLVARARSRRRLMALAWRLARGKAVEGQDYELLSARSLTVKTARKKATLAFDGEKRRETSPFEFRMSDDPLRIILPVDREPSS